LREQFSCTQNTCSALVTGCSEAIHLTYLGM
jgi:hypothetical protein